jgi:hypothetical protein
VSLLQPERSRRWIRNDRNSDEESQYIRKRPQFMGRFVLYHHITVTSNNYMTGFWSVIYVNELLYTLNFSPCTFINVFCRHTSPVLMRPVRCVSTYQKSERRTEVSFPNVAFYLEFVFFINYLRYLLTLIRKFTHDVALSLCKYTQQPFFTVLAYQHESISQFSRTAMATSTQLLKHGALESRFWSAVFLSADTISMETVT